MAEAPRTRQLPNQNTYRVIPTRFPPMQIFETLVDPDELDVLYAVESLTNDRLRAMAGNLYLVPKAEWVTGPGASVVMAAFTHAGQPSRFSDGSYGLYYAALDEATAVAETVFHSERRLRATSEAAIELDMRCHVGGVQQPMDDIRGQGYQHLADPDLGTWPGCQQFAATRRSTGAWGLLYRSARRKQGRCIAAFRPTAVTLPTQGAHLRYIWNGQRIDTVLTISAVQQL